LVGMLSGRSVAGQLVGEFVDAKPAVSPA
jgi:hypothetical protein